MEQTTIDAIKIDLENYSRTSARDACWGSTSNFWKATQGKASFDFVVDQVSLK